MAFAFGEVEAFDMEEGGDEIDEAESEYRPVDVNDDFYSDFEEGNDETDDYNCDCVDQL